VLDGSKIISFDPVVPLPPPALNASCATKLFESASMAVMLGHDRPSALASATSHFVPKMV
jgi:hypothetical protein